MKDQDPANLPPRTGTAEAAAVVTPPPVAALDSLPRGPLSWQVFALALPMLGEQGVNFLVGLVDTYLAGGLSKEATTAVGAASYFGWIMMVLFRLAGSGAVTLTARAVGARDRILANQVVNQALLLAALIGVVAGVAGVLAAPLMAQLLTHTPAAYDACLIYLRLDAVGFLFASVTVVSFAVLRAAGDTRTPLVVMGLLNVVNIVVSVALVQGWFTEPMGVVGIAIGTLIARGLSCILILLVFLRQPRGFGIRRALLLPDPALIWRMMRIGLPAAFDAACMSVAQLWFLRVVTLTATGDAATANTAAHMIGIKMEAIGYLPAFAWATAGATLAGQYLGAQRPADARRAGHIAAFQVTLVAAAIGALFVVGAPWIYQLMTDDPAVVAAGVPAFRIMGLVQPFLAAAIVYTVVLRGVGDTRMTMIFTLIAGFGLRVPIAYVGGVWLEGGLLGAWCGMWADNLAKLLLSGVRYTQGGWQRLKV